MSDQPQSAEAEVAIYFASTITGSLAGGAADELITSPVLSALGISKSDDTVARYLQKISQQLTALSQSLDDQMRGLQDSLSQIKSISTQIQDYLTHEGLAQVLRSYNESANTIATLFELFVDDVSALDEIVGSTTNTSSSNNPANDLYTNVLNAENALKVSEAMAHIRDLIVKPADFDKGILDYLLDMIRGEIQTFAQTDDNLIHEFTRDRDSTYPGLTKKIQYYDSYKIVTHGYDTARAELPKIAALFKNIVATQLRGLILLAKAWQESPHAPTLGLRTSEVMEGIKLMKAFYPRYKTTVDTTVIDSLKKNGKYLPDDYVHKVQLLRNLHARSNNTDPGGFMNHDWIMMRIEEREREVRGRWDQPQHSIEKFLIIWMVYQPWKEGSSLPAGADRYCLAGAGDEAFGGWTMPPNFPDSTFSEVFGGWAGNNPTYNPAMWDAMISPGLQKLPDNPPAELATVLNGLPTSEEAAVVSGVVLSKLLESSALRGTPLSFKCQIDGQQAVWLQGRPAGGALSLATKRDRVGAASTAWGVLFNLNPPDQLRDTVIKCLGFPIRSRNFLNGKTDSMQIGLATMADGIASGGTQWVIRPWEDNTVSFVRVVTEVERFVDGDGRPQETTVLADKGWLAGNADGSVSLTNFRNTPGLRWTVHPYVIDTA